MKGFKPLAASATPSELARRLTMLNRAALDLQLGLQGMPFTWGIAEAGSCTAHLEAVGLTLVTRTRAEKLGYKLKAKAKPVGRVYYGAPISQYASVYVLEVQCEKDGE